MAYLASSMRCSLTLPMIFCVLAKGFKDETTEAKQPITSPSSFHYTKPDDEPTQSLMQYVLEMARYDVDTDLRDRSRFVTALMGLAPSAEGEEDKVSTQTR